MVDSKSRVWMASDQGVHRFDPATHTWQLLTVASHAGPAFSLAMDADGTVYAATWEGLHRWKLGESFEAVREPAHPLGAVVISSRAGAGGELRAAGPDGVWRIAPGTAPIPLPGPTPGTVRAIAVSPGTSTWLGTPYGLWRSAGGGSFVNLHSLAGGPSSDVKAVTVAGDGTVWAGGLGGVSAYRGGRPVLSLTPATGLPCSEVQCLAWSPGGLWIGTAGGLARWQAGRWSWRHSRRWLCNDNVLGVAVAPDGTVWAATPDGLSALHAEGTTLMRKAELYLAACLERHIRPPGIVEKCRLRTPGDLTTAGPQDDDNDGGYTAVYLAMQSLRYAATHDPGARAQARAAMDALVFLREVAGTNGFFARTVIPADWDRKADPNETLSLQDQAARRVEDGRFKYVPERWRRSKDGRWLWKGDTSSDEVCAHFFGYFYYWQLAADPGERARVREQVGRIADHILTHHGALQDLDGAPTRWGVWTPDRVLHDPNWLQESWINPVELSSFLKLAHHVTGEARYEEAYRKLLADRDWRAAVRKAKNLNPATRTHIDDELLAFVYPALLSLEHDPALRRLYRESFENWHNAVSADQVPFFEFLYAALTGRREGLASAVEVLRDTPLDLVRWTVDNTRREDLRQVRRPELEHWQTSRLVPASERGIPRTDENVWRSVQGDGGATESDGVFWLLPYWLARQHGLLDAGR
jgi:hypothetical protein